MQRPFVTFIIGILVGASLPAAIVAILQLITTEERRMFDGFAQIKPDMPRSEVIQLMGSDWSRSESFHLGQEAGYEFEYRTAEVIEATYFLSWGSGVDTVFTVAFDQQDKAIYKASGGT